MSSTQDTVNVFLSLCFMALYENALNQTGNDTHLSYARCSPRYLGVARVPQRHLECFCCMGLSGNTLKQTENITHLSCDRLPLGHLGVSLCGQSKCGKSMKQTGFFLICFGLMITLTSYLGFLLLRKIRGYTKTRVKHRRRLGSGY